MAPTLFGIALLCCGVNSTVTATLAGQIVMEGFLDIRLPPWARRLLTRAIAIVPAALVTIWFGESGTAELLIEESGEELALRALLTGGDRLHRRPPAGASYTLVNHYGPTESTVVATAGRVEVRGEGLPALGGPIDNTRVWS